MTYEEYQGLLARSLDTFSEKTYENLMSETLDRVSQAYDKRDGSMIYNAIAALCFEIAMLYGALGFTFDATYIDTSPREYLIKRASDRSITPHPAKKAIYYADIERADPVSEGTRFSCEDMNFVVIPFSDGALRKEVTLAGEETSTKNRQLVECETAGIIGNSYSGTLIPIDYIDGLGKAELCGSDLYQDGVDEEDTEDFRARVKEEMRTIAFGGNIADYKRKVLELDGVGQVKVHPIWNGAGTVKIVITSENPASPEPTVDKVSEVQNIIDPSSGTGEGLAPIGHIVTVAGVTTKQVSVAMTVTLKGNSTAGQVETVAAPIIEEYFESLVKKWGDSDAVTILPSVISYKLLYDPDCSALISSVDSITITVGSTAANAWANVTLGADEVPVKNTVSVTQTT